MENPAIALLELFEEWRKPGNGSPQVSRGFNSNVTAALDSHLDAMCHLAALKAAVDALEASGYKVAAYRRNFRLWTKAVLNHPHAWDAPNSNAQAFTDHAIDTLENLAAAIDGHSPQLVEGASDKIEERLTEVIALLREDGTLSVELRQHIMRVIQTVRNCVEEAEAFGGTSLKDALYNLWISLYAAAGQSGDEGRGKWRQLADQILAPATAGLIGSIPSLGLSYLQLTHGS